MTRTNLINNKEVREWYQKVRNEKFKKNWICSCCGRMYPSTMTFCPKDNQKQEIVNAGM